MTTSSSSASRSATRTSPTTTATSSRWNAPRSSRRGSAPSAAPSRRRRTGSSARRTVSRVSSYVIDPPDGRIPALTPAAQAAAQQRQQAQAARRRQLNGIEAEWTTDRSNYDRCISTGVLNSITPKIYNSGSRIVQGPGWLAFQNEMIHETRVIPTDGRKQVGAARQELDGHVSWPLGRRRARRRDPQHQARVGRSTASRCRTRAC